ncbi:MAG: relaxase/mobilization nuclease domain-containing protein, partial [Synergistaceae bacterium]|nr:relaxase/mobilization nuclease domain-containing protein [Synergistaceae bacterium]
MATTAIFPIHARGRSVARAIRDVTDYVEDPRKTEGGELISSFECVPESAGAEFLLAKSQYHSLTGRSQKSDVVAYHARQSFKPGEITKEEANRIGYELAMRFTKGRHAFLVYTHTDRRHIHNHIIWNSTALDCRKKFRNFIGSAFALRRCSDILCAENYLSVVRDPKPSPGRDYGRYMGRPPSFQERIRAAIDEALARSPATFEDFLSLMRGAGYRVNTQRKHITLLVPDADGMPKQKQPTRLDTLKGGYTEAAIRERIEGRRIVSAPAGKTIAPSSGRRPSLLIDIETKIREGKGPGYAHWAHIHNIKQMARTLIFLQENELDDYAALKEKAAAATASFNDISSR